MDNKFVLRSTSIIGALMVALPFILGIFGYAPSPETLAGLGEGLKELVQAAGGLLTVYGLRNATGGITFKPGGS